MRCTLLSVYGDSLQDVWSRYCDGFQAQLRNGGDVYGNVLEAIRCPTLILHGAKDTITPEIHPQVLHNKIACSRLHVFSEGHHALHLAEPDAFDKIGLPFLRRPFDR